MPRFTPTQQALKALLGAQADLLTAAPQQSDSALEQFLNKGADCLRQITQARVVTVCRVVYSGQTDLDGNATLGIEKGPTGTSVPPDLTAQAVALTYELGDLAASRNLDQLHEDEITRLRSAALTDRMRALVHVDSMTQTNVQVLRCCAGSQTRATALALLFFVDSDGQSADQLEAQFLASEIIGQSIRLHRKQSLQSQRGTSSDTAQKDTPASQQESWLEQAKAGLDAFWEADPRGRITTLIPLSPRFQDMDRQKWIGMALPALPPANKTGDTPPLDSLLESGSAFRDIPVRTTADTGRLRVSFSGAPILPEHRDGVSAFAGCLTIASDDQGSEQERRALMELVSRLERSRDRERQLRTESETLLEGLRLLTKPLPSRQIFDGLFSLLQGTLAFEGAVLVRRHWQGHLTAGMATDQSLEDLDWRDIASQIGDGLPKQPSLLSEDHQLLAGIRNHGTATRDWKSGLAVHIDLENQPAWLICLHRQPFFFDMTALALAGRLALLTSQALTHDAERNKALQSAKLATLGEMATGIAHEMNQPLAAISLAAQNLELVLEDEPIDVPYAQGKVERIQAQTERASRIVNQMRVFARQSYEVDGHFKASDQIAAALQIVGEQLRSHNVVLTQSMMDDEPAVSGDPLQFEQVVLNLFSNARDAIDAHFKTLPPDQIASQTGRIDLTQDMIDADHMRIRFTDNGGGIPEDILPQLFDPFFTTKPVGEGTGLGLSISYGIMRDMGGAIEAHNGPDGAQIDLILKIAPSAQS